MKSSFDSKYLQMANHQKTSYFAIFLTSVAALLLLSLASPTLAAITWDGDVDPTDPNNWQGANGYIGKSSTGSITVDNGSGLYSTYGYLGYNPGSSGTVTLTDTGSYWSNGMNIFVGYSGSGILNIKSDAHVDNDKSVLGNNFGSTGTATVTGSRSKWNQGMLYVGNSGTGTLNIEAGGQVINNTGFLGYNAGSSGTTTVTGEGSAWTNKSMIVVGESGTGTLNIEAGGQVTCNRGYVGDNAGSSGTTTVAGASSTWIISATSGTVGGNLSVGFAGTGILNIKAGGLVNSSSYSYIGSCSNAIGTVTVNGADSKWINGGKLIIGESGTGTMNIETGGMVSNAEATIGLNAGSTGTVTVTGENSKWNCNGDLYVGHVDRYGGSNGRGSITVKDGGAVVVGKNIYATSTLFGNGTISANGGVVDANLVFDAAHGSQGTSNFDSGGTLMITPSANNPLGVGYLGNGTLRVTEGVTVASFLSYLGYHYGSSGTATVTGTGSKWTAGDRQIYVGYSGNGTLNIGSGIASEGMVLAKVVKLAENIAATATCNLNGGTLQTSSITIGSGTASFNWSDGTIRNFDASTGLAISSKNNLILQLAATGTHAFNIDAGSTGAVSAILSDATSGGTLSKQGDGLLALGAANTYTGTTTIEGGQLKLTSGGNIAYSSEIINRAGFLIDGGNHSVQKITGSGTTQVLSGSLTAKSIVQDTLTIGGSTNAVPEPSSLSLLALSALAILARRKR